MPQLSRRGFVPLFAAGIAAVAGSAGAEPMRPTATTPGLSDNAPDTVLPAGLHKISTNITIKGDLVLQPGARIELASGSSLTVMGEFSAPIGPVFSGAGRVDLNRSRTPTAYPEWFGAESDNGAADCLPAFRACMAAHPIMLLRAADYWFSDTLVVDRPFVRIWGAGYRGSDRGQGTRILVRSATADVMRVGFDTSPSSVNAFLQGVDIRWLELGRTMAVAKGPRGEPAGLRVQYVLCCQFEALSSRESGIGFAAVGAVRTHLRDCIAFRSLPGTTAGTWRGFQMGGFEAIGLAGTNGSIFLTDCNVSIGGNPGVTDAVGLLLEGGFADTFVINLEVTSLETGIRIDGAAQRIGGFAVAGHANLHLHMPVIDQCGIVGIDVRATSEYALIEISDPYIAVAPGATAAIRANGVHGALTVMGGQLIGRSAKGNAAVAGITAKASSGLDVNGIKIADFAVPVHLAECRGVSLSGQINNPVLVSDSPAITLRRCGNVSLRMRVAGKDGAFAAGIAVGEHPRQPLLIDASLIEDAALRGGAVVLGSDGRVPKVGRSGMLTIIGR